MPEEREKYYSFKIDFKSEDDRDEFKNYMHHIKLGKGIPIYRTAMEMLYLYKNKNNAIESLKKLILDTPIANEYKRILSHIICLLEEKK